MTNLYISLCVVYIIICISLIIVILLQKKRSSGLGDVMSGTNNSSEQTYWNKNRCRSLEGILERYTKILGTTFIILSFILCVIK